MTYNLFYYIATVKGEIAKSRGISKKFEKLIGAANLDDEATFVGMPEIEEEDLLQFELKSKILLLFAFFDNYIYECLNFLFNESPNIIASRVINIKISEFMEHGKDFLLQQKIDSIIQDMMRGGYVNFFDNLSKLKINHKVDEEIIRLINEYLQIRNLFAHNNGRVDTIFKRRVKTDIEIGIIYPLTKTEINTIWMKLLDIAEKMDIGLIKQFSCMPIYDPGKELNV